MLISNALVCLECQGLIVVIQTVPYKILFLFPQPISSIDRILEAPMALRICAEKCVGESVDPFVRRQGVSWVDLVSSIVRLRHLPWAVMVAICIGNGVAPASVIRTELHAAIVAELGTTFASVEQPVIVPKKCRDSKLRHVVATFSALHQILASGALLPTLGIRQLSIFLAHDVLRAHI
jgi:hypothetical protein